MDEALRQFVRDRANAICEYCHFPEENSFNPFQVDHIIADSHGGPTTESNLAWSCFFCNTYKGPNVAGWDAAEDAVVRLFHPRKDGWREHFEWKGAVLLGRTQIGRVTIRVLPINHSDAIAVRRALLDFGYRLS